MAQELLSIGRIRKAHGIRGEVSVDWYADSLDLLSGGVFLRRGNVSPVSHQIDSVRTHHGSLLVRFVGVADRTAAEALRGCEIVVPGDRLPEAGEGEVYLHELLGLSVVAVEDGIETTLGTITDVNDATGQEVWTVSREGQEDVLFPAVAELVLDFDLDARRVRIAPPPGLIELYRP